MVVEITHAPEEGFKLKPEKGINFPDSNLNVSSLTKEDLNHLVFIAKYADMVGYSFVQRPADVILLQKHLKRLKREDIGIILKIETNLAFKNLPALLFAVMRSKHCGVMIARGDLAVEIGYLRIAEVQEEILWLAEAAHLPVIWATQVLETQIKKGIATRAEISDVVKSVRAECVMLNKGPYILEAIKTLKDIDKRMAAHEDKKRKILRSLHVAKAFME
jgi:pyruvate kinase